MHQVIKVNMQYMYTHIVPFIQITFGSDFTQQFNELEQEYNILKEDLVVVVFKGIGLSLRYPGYQVSMSAIAAHPAASNLSHIIMVYL